MTEENKNSVRSPLFEALHQPRYYRQLLVQQIEAQTSRRLITYFANINHPRSGIVATDVSPFQDLLLDCEAGGKIDLLLHSPGGDIDAAEKLVYMLRERGTELRVVVTERAKSAATLIALAADEILMSATSELGPIDPQVTVTSSDGKQITRPAQSFLDGLEQIKKSVGADGQLSPAYYPLLSQLDPALLDYCEKSKERSKQFAQKWLGKHMLKDKPEVAKEIAARLADVKQYQSHGMVIDRSEAQQMGLNVRYLDMEDNLWQMLWRLHLAYDVLCRNDGISKIFESRKISLPLH